MTAVPKFLKFIDFVGYNVENSLYLCALRSQKCLRSKDIERFNVSAFLSNLDTLIPYRRTVTTLVSIGIGIWSHTRYQDTSIVACS